MIMINVWLCLQCIDDDDDDDAGVVTILSSVLTDWTHLAQRHFDANSWNHCNSHWNEFYFKSLALSKVHLSTFADEATQCGW